MKQLVLRFIHDTRAVVAFEAVIITPIMAWLFVGSFVFFDAFRTYNTSVKATYAVADVLSRQQDTVYASDIEGLADVFQNISYDIEGTSLRVTQILRTHTGHYRVDRSYATDGQARLFDADLPAIEDRLPIMAPGDAVLLVETTLPYRPAFNVGLSNLEFTNFTLTRPRYVPLLDIDYGIEPSYCGYNCELYEGERDDEDGAEDPGPDGA
ncbi:hypothetical protein GTA62_17500 [Roseobacter sp. HKCCD9010]|uniref:TadE/TadG family type IV pilus assembly protein n=1 Tax=unclassified Roseobacter TaxID=196798 RepID=UPI001492CA7D|nr:MULTISPECIES: hypothetical protein [unclassified Roseobacter]MBF9051459.1 hypothetical protein [Rhodobacterales bacterium HKCCD4356]NNV12983.1 hypothetical protein [Roseobacter sp. HKCCD7357]NNV17234.1 hypothetical protein [Roseobacter sp. HKCCD8768]NNV26840.1 hypothetical protein [Roseobacter sp. HKCCD8192]NNV30960.1 hypothetical protein [Roseobacter sp. HKCCD9061]